VSYNRDVSETESTEATMKSESEEDGATTPEVAAEPHAAATPEVAAQPQPAATSEPSAIADTPAVATTSRRADEAGNDPAPELRKLLELATKYPEIGPPVAELAFKLGQNEIAERLLRLGVEGEGAGVEYYFVMAHAARREKRWPDALQATVDALVAFEKTADEKLGPDDGGRLLHLIRLGYSTLMFDMQDVNAMPSFIETLGNLLPGLEARLGGDPFYRTLLAQTLWFRDRDASEKEWEKAAELADSEFTWNARGTWYREAERDEPKAERAYRMGLEQTPRSALLLHNLAQVLVERASRSTETDPKGARRLLNESDDLLRAALREDAPRVRRYIHGTRDRLNELRRKLPRPPQRGRGDTRGDRQQGPGPGRQQRPTQGQGPGGRGQGQGQDRGRRDSRDGGDRGDRSDRRGPKQDSFLTEGTVSLGEMVLAKLKEQQSKG
jgi:hypothetical protein